MKISLFAYSRQGRETGGNIMKALQNENIEGFTVKRLETESFSAIPEKSAEFYKEKFNSSEALIFVGSCGIGVRLIAPYIKSKLTDPAVLVVDELGKFVIPLLSGHIGGANELAKKLAEKIGALPVITTATDINGKFSVDSWAKAQGLQISDMKKAKEISAAILEGNLGFCSPDRFLYPLSFYAQGPRAAPPKPDNRCKSPGFPQV